MSNSKSENDPPAKKPRSRPASQRKSAASEPSPSEEGFNPEVLDKMVIALPLMEILQKDRKREPHSVIIDLNLDYPGGMGRAVSFLVKTAGHRRG